MTNCILKMLVGLVCVCLFSCANNSSIDRANAARFEKNLSFQSTLNQEIISAMAATDALGSVYFLGRGDVLELSVFQVDELNTRIRVNAHGEITLPLLGTIEVENKSVSEVEEIIRAKLKADFLQNPQVTLFIEEYRSQQIAVLGAVESPNIYSVRQTRSIFEMLSLAGGLTDQASGIIHIKTTQRNKQTGEHQLQSLTLSVRKLLEGADQASLIRLSGGDSILVPPAGSVFVEGAVKKPGSYALKAQTTVLKAVALAGGIPWSGKERSVKVLRNIDGEPYSISVNLHKIRNQKDNDIVLLDGDIVVVGYSSTKRFLSGFFRGATNFFGYELNNN